MKIVYVICTHYGVNRPHMMLLYCTADSRIAPSQWQTVLLCNDVSRWQGSNLESALYCLTGVNVTAINSGDPGCDELTICNAIICISSCVPTVDRIKYARLVVFVCCGDIIYGAFMWLMFFVANQTSIKYNETKTMRTIFGMRCTTDLYFAVTKQ